MTRFIPKAWNSTTPVRQTTLARLPLRRLSHPAVVSLGAPLCATLGMTASAPAHAYLGPGAGLGVFATLFGIVAAIVLALFGLLWYPLKRAFAKKGAADAAPASVPSPTAQDTARDQAPAAADPLARDAPDPKP